MSLYIGTQSNNPCSLPTVEQSAIACEGSVLELQCAAGIQILSSNYGRTQISREVCEFVRPHTDDVNCIGENTLGRVQQECDGEQECFIGASNAVFGDPCRGTYKFLEVSYVCNTPVV